MFFWIPDKLLPSVCENMGLGSGLYVSVAIWSHGGWIWKPNFSQSLGFLLKEGRMIWWMESQISTPWDFKWSCDGPSSVFLISHRQALLSPWYSIFRFSSAADSCGRCEEERQRAPHPHRSCWGNGGQVRQRQEIWWLMQSLGAGSRCSAAAAATFPCACPGSLSAMMQRGRQ